MDLPFAATSILAKAAWSASLVLGVSFVAERVSTRIAGILAGAPQNAVLIYFFVGRDLGVDRVVDSAPHGIASFSATIAFVLAYYLASSRCGRFSVAAGVVAGLAAFVAVAGLLAAVPFTLGAATALTAAVIGAAIWGFRRIAFAPVARPVRYTPALLILRGCFAAVLIVGAITLAEALDARWTGLMTGFPANLLPTLLIIHTTYGAATAHGFLRNFPLGVGSVVLYVLSAPLTFAALGVWGGTAASLAVSFAYLGAVALWGSVRREGASPPRQ